MYVFRFIIFNLNHEIYLFFKSFFFVTQRVQVKMYKILHQMIILYIFQEIKLKSTQILRKTNTISNIFVPAHQCMG